MRYELLFQPRIAHTRFDTGPLEAALQTKALTTRGDGVRLWRLQHGEVELAPVRENETQLALAASVPLSDKTELVRELVREGVALAAAGDVSLVDPQMGAVVSLASESSVADEFLKTARYAGEYMGVTEALGASFSAPEDEGMRVGTKVLLALVVFVVMAYLAFRAI